MKIENIKKPNEYYKNLIAEKISKDLAIGNLGTIQIIGIEDNVHPMEINKIPEKDIEYAHSLDAEDTKENRSDNLKQVDKANRFEELEFGGNECNGSTLTKNSKTGTCYLGWRVFIE